MNSGDNDNWEYYHLVGFNHAFEKKNKVIFLNW
jgi:hypothetical protein